MVTDFKARLFHNRGPHIKKSTGWQERRGDRAPIVRHPGDPADRGEAAKLTVFQRTPNFAFPAQEWSAASRIALPSRSDPAAYRQQAQRLAAGVRWPAN